MDRELAGRPSTIVAAAIEAFSRGDDSAFAAFFAPDAIVWAEPQLAAMVVLSGRAEIEAWCGEARARWQGVRFSHGELEDHGVGAYVELDVITEGPGGSGAAWRLPIAVFVRDGLVTEVAPQADRERALAALTSR
jgi:hypothetical protein